MKQSMPEWLEHIWAKSQESGEMAKPESLTNHTLKVLEKTSELINLRPFIPTVLSFPDFWNCLFWTMYFHDFGKSASGFQKMLRGGKPWGHRHEVFSVAFLDWIQGFSEEEYQLIASAILSHHKEAEELFLLYPEPANPDEDPLARVIEEFDDITLEGVWKWLKEFICSIEKHPDIRHNFVKIPEILPLLNSIELLKEHGAERIRRWLKIYRSLIRELNRNYEISKVLKALLLRGHALTADHMASANVDKLPQIHYISENEPIYEQLGLTKKTLYEHQEECSKISNSVILIAPTGSGKTESALLWALNQKYNGANIHRLFYTLPYQASMNAMYERLNTHLFSGLVGLEHSKNVLTLYRFLIEDNQDSGIVKRTAKWLKELVRLNYFPIKVLSPYQILKAFYRIKGYESTLTDFIGAYFIFDEVHAYEPERLAMILSSIKFLREKFRAKFFVMSATLSTIIQEHLLDTISDATIVKATPEIFKSFTRHKVRVLEGDLLDDLWIDNICKKVGEYNSILICCNTVKRAQHAYLQIKQRLKQQIDTILIHSRFSIKDRLKKEMIIKNATGSRSEERRPILLVSTQVIEVSMDIDLDVIFTDPAPLEALIQRFGRINRRRLKEWAFVFVFTKPDDGQGIYDDRLVKKAIEILKANNEKTIDEGVINTWLDSIYNGNILEDWNERYRKSYEEFYNTCIEKLKPFSASEALEEMFYKAFDAIEVLPSNAEEVYKRYYEENPLEAAQLLVPIRWRQLSKLRRDNKVKKVIRSGPVIVDVDYDCEFGLKL